MADNLPEKVLIVDDDPAVGNAVIEPLGRYKIKVHVATDLDTALYLFNQHRFEVVCIEVEFDPLPGLVLLQKWRLHEVLEKRLCGCVLLTGNRSNQDSGSLKLAQEIRDTETIAKPFTAIQLLPVLSRARGVYQRAVKYGELETNVLKLGSKPERFDKAVQMVKKQIPELGNRGTEMLLSLHEKNDKWEEALPIAEALMAKDNHNVSYINSHSRILLKLGRHKEALAAMEKADSSAPNNLSRLDEMAELYLQLNKPDEAVVKMKQLISFNPENPDMKFDMFSQLQEHGFYEHAHDLCKDTTSPIEVVRYYNNKGVALKSSGDLEAALKEYERSLTFYPKFKENYRILYNIALAHIGTKTAESYGQAKDYLEKCLELKKDFDKAQAKLEQVNNALNSKKKKKPA